MAAINAIAKDWAGERCDCKERAEQDAAKEAAQLAADLTHIDRREPVLMPGA